MFKRALKYFYRSGDVWVILGIAIFGASIELSGYLHEPWLFAIGVLALGLGGVQYTVRGDDDDRVVTAEKSTSDIGQAKEEDRA